MKFRGENELKFMINFKLSPDLSGEDNLLDFKGLIKIGYNDNLMFHTNELIIQVFS